MNQRNYRKELDDLLASLAGEAPPRLLLHACCAPCSSSVLELLTAYFDITLFFYNPNISTLREYEKREAEVLRLLSEMPFPRPVAYRSVGWERECFDEIARGLESAPEGGDRCTKCYDLRLSRTAELAREEGFDYFATTLSVSPYKNADKINAIGERLAAVWGVPHLPSDFKKRGGYLRSIELSREYGLYRQDFCGCEYSYFARHPEA